MSRKAIIIVRLVPEAKDVDKKKLEEDIQKSLGCDWLAEVEAVTATL